MKGIHLCAKCGGPVLNFDRLPVGIQVAHLKCLGIAGKPDRPPDVPDADGGLTMEEAARGEPTAPGRGRARRVTK